MTASVTAIRSIQGEQAEAEQLTLWADQATVDEFVKSLSDGATACRERGRHWFPTIREAGIRFDGLDTNGYRLRRLKCKSCELVEKVERWNTRGRGRTLRHFMEDSYLNYIEGEHGEKYIGAAGKGRMKPRQFQEALATEALAGMSLGQLNKQAREAAVEKKSAAS